MRILVVDDAMFMKKMLEGILTKHGHTIVGEASNGREALNEYKKHNPDLVTMDITMPKMDGLECLKVIKHKNADAKVVMITAAGQKDKMMEAIKNGASEFVTKPFDKEEIGKVITRVLSE